MRGKRGTTNIPRSQTKKAKRSKKFWQQRKTNTVCQLPTSENDDSDAAAGHISEDEEPTTEYQQLLETFTTNEGSKKNLVSESESEESESDDGTDAGNLLRNKNSAQPGGQNCTMLEIIIGAKF